MNEYTNDLLELNNLSVETKRLKNWVLYSCTNWSGNGRSEKIIKNSFYNKAIFALCAINNIEDVTQYKWKWITVISKLMFNLFCALLI